MSIQNKIALITGASRGIGKAISIRLAKVGVFVLGVDYNEDAVKDISLFLNELNLQGEGIVMDVTDSNSIEKVLSQIVKKYGTPNILINNAGIAQDNIILNMLQDEWDRVIVTNLTAVFRIISFCLNDMVKANWGRIINIGSVAAYTGNAGQTNYAASKAGLVAFSKSLANEVALSNITVNCIAPGLIETAMIKNLSEEQKEKLLLKIPMRRIGSPEDIANTVAFLISEEASYITGATIHVNGGMYMI